MMYKKILFIPTAANVEIPGYVDEGIAALKKAAMM